MTLPSFPEIMIFSGVFLHDRCYVVVFFLPFQVRYFWLHYYFLTSKLPCHHSLLRSPENVLSVHTALHRWRRIRNVTSIPREGGCFGGATRAVGRAGALPRDTAGSHHPTQSLSTRQPAVSGGTSSLTFCWVITGDQSKLFTPF